VEQRSHEVTSSTLSALTHLIDLKDQTTGVHSSRLVARASAVARALGLSAEETRQVKIAAVLHDFGKIGVPDEILKKPSSLTAEEQTIMRKHPEYGWAVIRNIPGCEMASLLILHHHEMWNGAGYPGHLNGPSIPLGARIIAITDAFDAMTSDRCYRKGMPTEKALATLQEFAGSQFDPEVVDTFIDCFNAV
jgi:HD-GYP domain-containing protein (c-di-GMP phosphodiesterase class II)